VLHVKIILECVYYQHAQYKQKVLFDDAHIEKLYAFSCLPNVYGTRSTTQQRTFNITQLLSSHFVLLLLFPIPTMDMVDDKTPSTFSLTHAIQDLIKNMIFAIAGGKRRRYIEGD